MVRPAPHVDVSCLCRDTPYLQVCNPCCIHIEILHTNTPAQQQAMHTSDHATTPPPPQRCQEAQHNTAAPTMRVKPVDEQSSSTRTHADKHSVFTPVCPLWHAQTQHNIVEVTARLNTRLAAQVSHWPLAEHSFKHGSLRSAGHIATASAHTYTQT